jgi:hypothetical protein
MNSWKVDAAFGRDADLFEGEVHQHGFAAPHPAPHVDAPDRLGAAPSEAGPEARAPAAGQIAGEPFEMLDGGGLVRVGAKLARRDHRRVARRRAPSPALAPFPQRPGPGGDHPVLLLDQAAQESEPAGLANELDRAVERLPSRPTSTNWQDRSSVTEWEMSLIPASRPPANRAMSMKVRIAPPWTTPPRLL